MESEILQMLLKLLQSSGANTSGSRAPKINLSQIPQVANRGSGASAPPIPQMAPAPQMEPVRLPQMAPAITGRSQSFLEAILQNSEKPSEASAGVFDSQPAEVGTRTYPYTPPEEQGPDYVPPAPIEATSKMEEGEVILPKGQEDINPDFHDRLKRASAIFGKPIRTTSAHQGRPNRPGSMHPRKLAVDIDMSGMDDTERLRLGQALKQSGILRYGTYDNHPNMLHVDMSTGPTAGTGGYMHNTTGREFDKAPQWLKDLAKWNPAAAEEIVAEATSMRTPGPPKIPMNPAAQTFVGGTNVPDPTKLEKTLTSPGLGAMAALSMIPGLGPLFAMPFLAGQSLRNQRLVEAGALRSGKASPYRIETIPEGEESVTYRFNPNTGQLEPLASGPRWNEQENTAKDPAAVAIAKEIRDARERAGNPMSEQEYADLVAKVHYQMRPTSYDEERARMTQFGQDFPEDLKNQAIELKNFASVADRAFNAGVILEDIFEVTGASGWQQIFSSIPNTNAQRLKNVVDTLKSNIVLDQMIRLKEASPQGATGFGAMNLQELKTLQESIAALNPSGSEEDLKADLVRVMRLYKRVYESAVEGYRLGREWYNDYNQVPYTPRPLPTRFAPVEERFDPWSEVKKVRDSMRPENNNQPGESNW